MKKGLKEKLEDLRTEVKQKERELMMKNVFQGAGQVSVIVSDSLGKALDLKKEVYGYVLGAVSTNGALQYTEDRVDELIKELPEGSSGARKHVALL